MDALYIINNLKVVSTETKNQKAIDVQEIWYGRIYTHAHIADVSVLRVIFRNKILSGIVSVI